MKQEKILKEKELRDNKYYYARNMSSDKKKQPKRKKGSQSRIKNYNLKKWKNYSTITMKESKTSLGTGIGLLAGIIIGSVTDNVGLGIALGLCFGAGIGSTLEKKTKWKN